MIANVTTIYSTPNDGDLRSYVLSYSLQHGLFYFDIVLKKVSLMRSHQMTDGKLLTNIIRYYNCPHS